MYKLCKTEQSAARQRELEEGLLRAMSHRHYDEISVSDLCDEMGIPRKSFYRYFSGKDGALHALIDHTLLSFEAYSLENGARAKGPYYGNLERFFAFWLQQKPLLDALGRSSLSGELVMRTIHHALSDTGEPSLRAKKEDGKSWKHAITFCVCGLMSLVLDWHREGYALSPRQMSDIATRLLTEPLFGMDGSLN